MAYSFELKYIFLYSSRVIRDDMEKTITFYFNFMVIIFKHVILGINNDLSTINSLHTIILELIDDQQSISTFSNSFRIK